MAFVLDASVALSWCFADETSPITEKLLEKLATEQETGLVPSVWHLEIMNILVGAERKKRISYAEMTQCLSLLMDLPIETDLDISHEGLQQIMSLAHTIPLTTYDAAYLALAIRKDCPLATKDNALAQAAKKLGVPLLLS